ncbi:hypothetical protein D3C71_1435870 [compost metagenome]
MTDLLPPSPAAQLTDWPNQGRKSSPQRAVIPSRPNWARAGLLRSPLRTTGISANHCPSFTVRLVWAREMVDGASLSLMVTRVWCCSPSAAPLGSNSSRVKVSSPSCRVSLFTGIWMVWLSLWPAAQFRVPVRGATSLASALPKAMR